MSLQCIPAASITPQAWRNGGGLTRELWVWPPASSQLDWQLRITLAEVAQDGPFSAFPGVQRHLVVVDGCGLSLRWSLEGAWQDLVPGHLPVSFDGAQPPDCRLLRVKGQPARSTDLNLMLRGPRGRIQAMQAGQAMTLPTPQRGFFAAQAGRWWCAGEPAQVVAAQTLVWQDDHAASPGTWQFEPLHVTQPDQPLGWWLDAQL